jgi:hypothetical protein
MITQCSLPCLQKLTMWTFAKRVQFIPHFHGLLFYEHLYCHVFQWLRRRFGLVNRFIGSSLVVTTNNCNTFKITVITTHTVLSHTLSLHRSPTNFSWLSASENWIELLLLFSLYDLRTYHAQKTQFYFCIKKTPQRTSHVIPSQRLYWCSVA